jgi:hypothetical protein
MRPFNDHDWNTLPHITLTAPGEWNPAILDSTISEDWYQKQNKELEFLRQGILTETGDLKPNLEDDEDDYEEEPSRPTSRNGIKVFLTSLIEDELHEGFIICEVNGEQVPIDYVPILHDEFFAPVYVSCYPVWKPEAPAERKTLSRARRLSKQVRDVTTRRKRSLTQLQNT